MDQEVVGMVGFEPTRLAAHAPKACASAISPHPQAIHLEYSIRGWRLQEANALIIWAHVRLPMRSATCYTRY
jgi:hypothetical protein